MRKFWKIILITGLVVLTIAMVMHWGFFGLIVFTIVYGLVAESLPKKTK